MSRDDPCFATMQERLRYLAQVAKTPVMRNSLNAAAQEIDRLQKIIDSRPAINDGLPMTYVNWSQAIYAAEIAREGGYDA